MTEPSRTAGMIRKMEAPAGEPKPRDAVSPYLNSKEFGRELTALGFFWEGEGRRAVVQPPRERHDAAPQVREGRRVLLVVRRAEGRARKETGSRRSSRPSASS